MSYTIADYLFMKYSVQVQDIFNLMMVALENDDLPFDCDHNKNILHEFLNWHK